MDYQPSYHFSGSERRASWTILGPSHKRDLSLALAIECNSMQLHQHCGIKEFRTMGMGNKHSGKLILLGFQVHESKSFVQDPSYLLYMVRIRYDFSRTIVVLASMIWVWVPSLSTLWYLYAKKGN